MSGGRGAIFIDVDKTFIDGHASFGFLRHLVMVSGISCLGVRRLLKIVGLFVLDNLPFYDRSTFARRFGRVFEGVSKASIESVTAGYFERSLRHAIHPWFREHVLPRRREMPIVLLSGSPDFLLGHFKGEFVDEVISTRCESDDGIYTGRSIGDPVVGRGKYDALIRYCAESGIDPAASEFYSDHHSDAEVLSAVGTPVAFRPDARLRRIADSRGWRCVR